MSRKLSRNHARFTRDHQRKPDRLAAGRKQASLALIEPLEGRLLLSALDLTTAGAFGGLNGAIFAQTDAQPTGSGYIQPFVRFRAQDTEAGYNTTGQTEFATKDDGWCRAVQISEIPTVDIGGTLYREFLLDINQTGSAPLLSLDALKVFVGSTPDATNFAGWGAPGTPSLAYDLGDGNSIKLDYSLNHGSGSGDMLAFIPDNFLGADKSQYLYLYSSFGNDFPANDGYEEWATANVPLPTDPVSGMKFEDHNGNGVQDDGDQGLEGWTIFLDTNKDGTPDNGEVSTVTGADGSYAFPGLVAGFGDFSTVNVREVGKTGWTQTTPNPDPIPLPQGGQVITGVNFGNFKLGSISGMKWQDYAGNGVKDPGDDPVPSWTIMLYADTNQDGVLDNGDTHLQDTTTDSQGNYQFADLMAGTYFVTEVPLGLTNPQQTFPADSAYYTVTIVSGTVSTDNDFGNWFSPPGLMEIFGLKFADTANFGVWDRPQVVAPQVLAAGVAPGDSNLDGVVNFADYQNFEAHFGTAGDWTQGDFNGDGRIGFADYQLLESNFGSTAPQAGGQAMMTTSLAPVGEVGLPGWTIQLYMDQAPFNGIPDANEVIATTTTGVGGIYHFGPLDPSATYFVREVQQTGWVRTTVDPVGPITGVAGEYDVFMPVAGFVSLGAGQTERLDIGLAIGNAHFGGSDARTLGFWANTGTGKNGKTPIVTAEDLVVLSGMNLRNADGTDFDPTTLMQLHDWLLGGSATNMADMLSVQLTAMKLNTLHGYVDTSSAVLYYVNGDPIIITIGNLMTEANDDLGTPLLTPGGVLHEPLVVLGGNPLRPEMAQWEMVLDDANNNLNFLF